MTVGSQFLGVHCSTSLRAKVKGTGVTYDSLISVRPFTIPKCLTVALSLEGKEYPAGSCAVHGTHLGSSSFAPSSTPRVSITHLTGEESKTHREAWSQGQLSAKPGSH